MTRRAVVLILSTPLGLFGLETVKNLVEFSINLSCLTFACSPLNNTCSVILFQINTFPDSTDIIYLKYIIY